jgi:ribonuclease P protein component
MEIHAASGNGLRRGDRLRRSKDFARVMDTGQFFRYPVLTLAVRHHSGQGTRMGLSVGKRVGKAVVRSKVKRRIREAYRVRRPRLIGDVDLIFFARPEITETDFQGIEAAMDRLLARAQLWAQPRSRE